jgi:putative flippase GtrA
LTFLQKFDSIGYATSNKQQATSNKQQATSNKQQATSNKQQATSNKQQANYSTFHNHVKSFLTNPSLFFEFFRYLLVGGSAFLLDIGILYITKKYLFSGLGTGGILLAAALGFTAGLLYNFFLSLVFVFRKVNHNAANHKIRSFVLFAIIGIIGLGFTETGMYGGIKLLGQNYYLLVKIVTAVIVLMWNYIARKIFVFRK